MDLEVKEITPVLVVDGNVIAGSSFNVLMMRHDIGIFKANDQYMTHSLCV